MTPVDGLALLAALAPAFAGLRAPAAHRARSGAGMTLVARALWAAFGGLALLAVSRGGGDGVLLSHDGASLTMALLVSGVAALVATFSRRHMQADPRRAAFARRLGLLASSALMIALAADVVALALAWVASGAALASLIGHVDGWADARAAARRARAAFALGDAAMVAGLSMLAASAGTIDLGAILTRVGDGHVHDGLVTAAALLLLCGAASRAALPPAHGWLMSSVAAPTPVSAIMHAGLVNAGGFVLIKLATVLSAAPLAAGAATLAGALGAALGGAIMLSRSDVKGALAASTVAQMGFMVMQIGLGAYAHALLHIVAHGLFKAALFLGAAGAPGTRASAPARPRAALAITAAGALLLLAFVPQAGAPAVLALFALATAAQAGASALGSNPGVGRLALTGATLAGCIGLYVGGLAAADAILGAQASATPTELAWAAVLCLLALWAAVVVRGCPPGLRVALMSAGALRRAA